MSDPISSASADPDTLPTNAEDRKAAAALSALNTNDIGADADASSAAKPPSSADQEALGKAMSRLEIAAGGAQAGNRTGKTQQKQVVDQGAKKKPVKVSTEDVNLLVDQLDLSKIKATELLKANEGDIKQAIRSFIAPAIINAS
ncbi:hypothetical protein ASPZODRAFT_100520 [Penicilliopsis zonata CBS 506.65]|uniref:Nascent polypeptide-associated complex subunit alpha-like UBA domain-containing protein n=1 Tax=Penicilliopsis zonata CBS 506.65 TaxID=1073090 RepID=A0A1L9SBN0_9EURO|nr:hypothetical protein ASPZODRAFT_100520 [Penicilliopsis zonata CBS 506.65]OJJ44544.1 hypothetical protein ASPZODRAFT_100520 [Penicilliopsis zonata CBS 506.65]